VSSNESCDGPVADSVHKYWPVGAGVLLGFGVLLLVAVGFAFKLTCSEKDENVELNSQGSGSRFTDALAAGGSGADSKGHYKYTW
jgi:hypothetical protein